MYKFIKQIGNKWWLLLLIFLCVAGQVAFSYLLPMYMGEIIDLINTPSVSQDLSQVVLSSLKMIGAAAASCAFSVANVVVSTRVATIIMDKVREELFKKIVNFSPVEFNQFDTSSLVGRTMRDTHAIAFTFLNLFHNLLYGPLLAIAAVIVLLSNGFKYQLAVLIISIIILFTAIVYLIYILTKKKHYEVHLKEDKLSSTIKSNIEGIKVIRAYDAEAYQQNKIKELDSEITTRYKYVDRLCGIITPCLQLTMGILTIGVNLISAYLIKDLKFDFSGLTIVTQYSIMLLNGFMLVASTIARLPRSIEGAKRINEVLESKPILKEENQEVVTSQKGTIEFKDVSFTYPGASAPCLNHISFKVNKGETIAFIGGTGSGKTTLVNLLHHFYDASEGKILIDGEDISKYKRKELYSRFGYVPQKAYLFHDSILNNVALGKPGASLEEINKVLEITESKEFVDGFNDGINYEISEGGKNISGGQRQRLSIARALLLNPEIFIFDDSFSALDYKTDRVVRKKIKENYKDATNVIVAQRVGTIMDADQIIVLDKGNVVGHGTHDELVKNCPIYNEIVMSQLKEENQHETR